MTQILMTLWLQMLPNSIKPTRTSTNKLQENGPKNMPFKNHKILIIFFQFLILGFGVWGLGFGVWGLGECNKKIQFSFCVRLFLRQVRQLLMIF